MCHIFGKVQHREQSSTRVIDDVLRGGSNYKIDAVSLTDDE